MGNVCGACKRPNQGVFFDSNAGTMLNTMETEGGEERKPIVWCLTVFVIVFVRDINMDLKMHQSKV